MTCCDDPKSTVSSSSLFTVCPKYEDSETRRCVDRGRRRSKPRSGVRRRGLFGETFIGWHLRSVYRRFPGTFMSPDSGRKVSTLFGSESSIRNGI